MGRQFWSGLSGGSAVGGAYENWGSGEPNNSPDEDFLQISQAKQPDGGEWNDWKNLNTGTIAPAGNYQPSGYVRETNEGNLPIAFHENGDTYELAKISYTTGKKGDVLYLTGEIFTTMNVKTVADASEMKSITPPASATISRPPTHGPPTWTLPWKAPVSERTPRNWSSAPPCSPKPTACPKTRPS